LLPLPLEASSSVPDLLSLTRRSLFAPPRPGVQSLARSPASPKVPLKKTPPPQTSPPPRCLPSQASSLDTIQAPASWNCDIPLPLKKPFFLPRSHLGTRVADILIQVNGLTSYKASPPFMACSGRREADPKRLLFRTFSWPLRRPDLLSLQENP